MATLADYVTDYMACVLQQIGSKFFQPHRQRRTCTNKLLVECDRFLAARLSVIVRTSFRYGNLLST